MKKIGRVLIGILVVLVLLIGILYFVSPEVTTVHIETEIDAPAEEVWTVLAHEFATIDKWSSTVETSRAIDVSEVPAGWEVDPDALVPGRETVSPAGAFREILIDYSDEEMDLTFRADGLPSFITRMTDRQQVIALDNNRSKVTFDVEMQASGIFRALGPILGSRFSSTFGTVQEELKTYVETGQPVQ